jgi:hypothetical protein
MQVPAVTNGAGLTVDSSSSVSVVEIEINEDGDDSRAEQVVNPSGGTTSSLCFFSVTSNNTSTAARLGSNIAGRRKLKTASGS